MGDQEMENDVIEVNDIVNVKCVVTSIDKSMDQYEFLALDSIRTDKFWIDGDAIEENVTLVEKGSTVPEPVVGYVLMYPDRGKITAAVWSKTTNGWVCEGGSQKPVSWAKLVNHAKNNDLVIEEISITKRLV